MARMSVSEARAQLPDVLDRVAAGEEITITRHGVAAAVVMRPDAVRTRRAEAMVEQAREVGVLLAQAREQPLSQATVRSDRAAELVEDVRTGRDR